MVPPPVGAPYAHCPSVVQPGFVESGCDRNTIGCAHALPCGTMRSDHAAKLPLSPLAWSLTRSFHWPAEREPSRSERTPGPSGARPTPSSSKRATTLSAPPPVRLCRRTIVPAGDSSSITRSPE